MLVHRIQKGPATVLSAGPVRSDQGSPDVLAFFFRWLQAVANPSTVQHCPLPTLRILPRGGKPGAYGPSRSIRMRDCASTERSSTHSTRCCHQLHSLAASASASSGRGRRSGIHHPTPDLGSVADGSPASPSRTEWKPASRRAAPYRTLGFRLVSRCQRRGSLRCDRHPRRHIGGRPVGTRYRDFSGDLVGGMARGQSRRWRTRPGYRSRATHTAPVEFPRRLRRPPGRGWPGREYRRGTPLR
jgi:hypothetical protein